MRGIRRIFRLRGSGQVDLKAELDEEISAHIEMRVADLIRVGTTALAAWLPARRAASIDVMAALTDRG